MAFYSQSIHHLLALRADDLESTACTASFDQFAGKPPSSFSFEDYTTKLVAGSFTQDQIEKAERAAHAIRSGTTSSAHVLEERTEDSEGNKHMERFNDVGVEEDQYSRVLSHEDMASMQVLVV